MMGDEAHAVGVELTVLAATPSDPASRSADHVLVGAADDEESLRRLAGATDVVTFDHELVDLELLARLEALGTVCRPSSSTLRFSVDKAFQRTDFAAADLPVPHHVILRHETDLAALASWSQRFGSPPVLKASRGA